MNTITKIFKYAFLIIAVIAFIAVLAGATHQIFVSAISLMMYFVINPDKDEKG